MGVIRWLLILIVLFVLIVFGAENMEPITLKFSIFNLFSYKAEMPLFFVVVVAVFSGAALAGLIGLADHVRLRSQLRKQRKAVARLEDEVKSLRNLPLEDELEGDISPVTSG
jgi:putative membrane protein